MKLKFSITLIVSFAFYASAYTQPTDERIVLTKVIGFRPFSTSSINTRITTETGFKGLPAGLKDYLIREAKVLPTQQEEKYGKYVKGEMDVETFVTLFPKARHVKKSQVRRKIFLVVGEDEQGQRIIIVDSNHDKDFSNDQVFKYTNAPDLTRRPSGDFAQDEKFMRLLERIPSVTVPIESFDGEKLVVKDLSIKCCPYRAGYSSNNKRDTELYAAVYLFEYRIGSLTVGEKKYKIATDATIGPTPAFRSDLQVKLEFVVCEEREDGEWRDPLQGPRHGSFLLGDSLLVDGWKLKMKSISTYGDTLKVVKTQTFK